MALNEVHITVSNQLTGDTYLSRSYPDEDFNNNGKIELYKTPVYKVFIESKTTGGLITREWKALRFMPYFNDPKSPIKGYKSRGWVNSGKHEVSKKKVTYFDPNYATHNRHSPFNGAIQIDGNFLIHAGPLSIADSGWGAAGCVEIIGDFGKFKSDIKDLSGSKMASSNDAIQDLVKNRKLTLQVDRALPPDIRKGLSHEF